MGDFLKAQGRRVAKQAAELYRERHPEKAQTDEIETRDRDIAVLLAWEYSSLPPEIVGALKAAASEGAWQGANQIHAAIGGEFAPMHQAAETAAKEWAEHRAKELAGETEEPRWAISETAKAEVTATVAQAIAESWTPSQLEAAIEGSTLFTQQHANLIADQETARAQTWGWYQSWVESRAVAEVAWRLSVEHSCCDVCDAFAAKGSVEVGHQFAPGVTAPPDAHPNCECWLEITKFVGDDES